ncbi:MAG: hypothetical protein JXA71_20665 [Chitinispirillaceae bacterium]|nr:hypothetical protein [Chitinispirillaceae bacterium]
MKKIFFTFLCLVVSGNPSSAGSIELLPERVPFFSATAMEFCHYVFTGAENGSLVNHGNLGVEFPAAGFSLKESTNCLAGFAAAVHLVMFPDDMKFPVDNFYATLALYAECFRSEKISCRFYPVYHVSGHLGDGAENDSALVHARAVSSEMSLLEVSLSPLRSVSFSAGYGYYYHVCAQQGLTDRFDLAVRCQPARGKGLKPFLTIAGRFINLNAWRAGVDAEAGAEFVCAQGRGVGVSLRYFNRMHPGYYFEQREKSAGVKIFFLL